MTTTTAANPEPKDEDFGFLTAYNDGKSGIDYDDEPTVLIISPLQYWLAD